MTWFSLVKVFHLVIYSNKNLLCFLFLPNSWTHLFLDLGTWGLMTSLPVPFGSRALLWKMAGLVEVIIAVLVAAVFRSFHRTTFSYFFMKQIWQKWGRDLHACDFKWWFVVFRINDILKTNKKDEYECFLFSPFPLRNKNKLKIYIYILYIAIPKKE